ncbi:MAG: VIT and VWA domain-containing protein [Acidobacteriaceae bacterium]
MSTLALAALALSIPLRAWADAGVLIPGGQETPDATVLSLEEMTVDVKIDDGDARVRITQIFANHTGRVQEGMYTFALPAGSTVSDFAVWDGPVRVPAVILERRRAQEIYEQAKMQSIDPGLLQLGERDEEASRTALFSAKIVPIPAYGTKRLELEYRQRLEATDFKQQFVLPLKPDAYQQQTAKRFSVRFELHSSHDLQGFLAASKVFPLKLTQSDAHTVVGAFDGSDLALSEDLTAAWTLGAAAADRLEVAAYRDPAPPQPQADETAPVKAAGPEPAFFEASVLIGNGKGAAAAADLGPPRTVVVLFDNSLSMQWEKLERSYAALEGSLRKLRPVDRFNVVLFNQDVSTWKPQPALASAENVQAALDFVRASKLRGGTDLGKALTAGLAQAELAPHDPAGDVAPVLVLLTDGGSDRGESVLTRKIAAKYSAQWSAAAHRPKTDVFAVGDDANLPLLKLLAKNDGVLESVLSTEPVDFKLASFLSKITRSPVSQLGLVAPKEARLVYPMDDAVYTGSVAQWVGQYATPVKRAEFAVHAARDPGGVLNAKATVALPATALEHEGLPRLWAQARVDALLEQIARDGETSEAIDEIIRLSRRYKFVTPYTSFLAVPRALLRPRVIRPGDPVLRVRTDPAIVSVIALFPFGLTKLLRHLATEDTRGADGARMWETRFLAPEDMKDGTYSVRLVLRDAAGNTYKEAKTFVIASTPPTVKVLLDGQSFHRGQPVLVRASASASTRTLTARLEGAAPVGLRWNQAMGVNTGEIVVPQSLPIGRYTLTVTAEDIAHNLGSQEVQVDVVP